MVERTRRDFLRFTGGGAAALAIAATFGCRAEYKENLPDGFSERTRDYRYKIIIDAGSNQNLKLYTNQAPELKGDEGQGLLSVRDVFCPKRGNDEDLRKRFHCDRQYFTEFSISTPKRIIVQDRQGKK